MSVLVTNKNPQLVNRISLHIDDCSEQMGMVA
jgi:hypothetical protein